VSGLRRRDPLVAHCSPVSEVVGPRLAVSRVEPRPWRGLASLHPALWPCLLLLAAYAVTYVVFARDLIQFPFDWDQGEGYDAWSAYLVDQGQLPYTSNAAYPYYSSNYPPVWSYLVSIAMAWTGPGLGAARLVSSLAAVLATAVIGYAAWRRSRSWIAPVLAAGFFLASPYVFHSTPLSRVNGTTLLFAALAVTLVELPTRRRVVWGSAFLLAALFTKQTSADAAAACLLYLLLVVPRRGLAALLAIGVAGLAGLLALNLATDGAFWLNNVSGNANPFVLGQLTAYLSNFGELHAVLLLLAGWEVVAALRARAWSSWVFYWLIALVASLGVGKTGAGESYFLGAIAATCVLASARVASLASRVSRGAAIALGAALLLQAVVLAHGPWADLAGWLPDRGVQGGLIGRSPSPEDYAAGQQIVAMLRKTDKPVLSEDPSFAVEAGKPVIANATHLRNLYDAGLWNPDPLVADVESHRFGAVVLNAERYPEPVLRAIGASYYLARVVEMNGFSYKVFLPGSE